MSCSVWSLSRRLHFVPFGTVKSVINAAKAGCPSGKEIEVRHASKQEETAPTGAEVRRTLRLQSMQVAESPHHAASHLMCSQEGAAATACGSGKVESTGAKDTATADSIMTEDTKPRTAQARHFQRLPCCRGLCRTHCDSNKPCSG